MTLKTCSLERLPDLLATPSGNGIIQARFFEEFFLLKMPRGVTVAQVPLEHFVMVRIHARQPLDPAWASLVTPPTAEPSFQSRNVECSLGPSRVECPELVEGHSSLLSA